MQEQITRNPKFKMPCFDHLCISASFLKYAPTLPVLNWPLALMPEPEKFKQLNLI